MAVSDPAATGRKAPGRTDRLFRLAAVGVVLLLGATLALLGLRSGATDSPRFGVTEPPPPPMAFLSTDLDNYDLALFPPSVLRGGRLIARHRCLECHRIEGDGTRKGIALRHTGRRRTKAWLIAHFRDPKSFSPQSKMPSYAKLPEGDLSDMADYLLALR